MSRVFVRPGGVDRRVPIPGQPRQFVPEGGMEMEDTAYVQRRLACGDLVLGAPAAAASPAVTPAAPVAAKKE